MPAPASAKQSVVPLVSDAFCLRLALAMLYRAGLDAMDEKSLYACEAQDFLNSEFAMLAVKVIQSTSSRDIDFGDTSDYLGHYQRVSKQRMMQARSPKKKRNHSR